MTTLLDSLKTAEFDTDSRGDFIDEFPDDLKAEIAPDAPPGRKTGARSTPAPSKPARPRASAAVRKRVRDELLVYAEMIALGWSIRDPHCGGVLHDQAEAIVDSLAEIISRNPALVQWVHTSGVLGDWAKVAMAVWPVVAAIRDHHVVKKVDDAEGGSGGVDFSAYAPYRPHAA